MAQYLKEAAINLLPFNAMAKERARHHHSSNAVSEAVFVNPKSLGLAIIISNDYIHTQLKSLTGTHIDSEAMQNTFKQLKYAVVCRHNINKHQLLNIITEASIAVDYPSSYQRIVFVFSGHGSRDNCLYTQDCQRISLDTLISMFLPRNAQHLAGIPKLFFIDACRGDKIDPGLLVAPRGPTSHPRGGKVLPTLRLPSEGNYLLAYSTMHGYQAYETKGKGGIWLSLLSQHLAFFDKSVLDILTDINKEMMEEHQEYWKEYIQQPELHSSLNEPVYFLREANEDISEGIDFEASVTCMEEPTEPSWLNITPFISSHVPEAEPEAAGEQTATISTSSGSSSELTSDPDNYTSEDCSSSSMTSSNDYTIPAVLETLSRSAVQHPFPSLPSPFSPPKATHTTYNLKQIRSRGISPCFQLEEYCQSHHKPLPTYSNISCNERGKYLVKVYVAKTVGWVEGLKMSKKELAKESAANELLKRLKYYEASAIN